MPDLGKKIRKEGLGSSEVGSESESFDAGKEKSGGSSRAKGHVTGSAKRKRGRGSDQRLENGRNGRLSRSKVATEDKW